MTPPASPNTHPADTWLAAARTQPDSAQWQRQSLSLPPWLEPLAEFTRTTDIHGVIGDATRRVPDAAAGTDVKLSAVAIVFSGDATSRTLPADAAVIVTHRNPEMRHHSGQIAFPGGRREDEDADPIATALREAEEEVGLDPASVIPFAVLDPVYIPPTGFAVVPVLVWQPEVTDIWCASEENDWVQRYPLHDLIDPAQRASLDLGGKTTPAWWLGDPPTRLLWGFTAMLLDTIIRCAEWEQPWDSSQPEPILNALQRATNDESWG